MTDDENLNKEIVSQQSKSCYLCGNRIVRGDVNDYSWHKKKFCCYECTQKFNRIRKLFKEGRIQEWFDGGFVDEL